MAHPTPIHTIHPPPIVPDHELLRCVGQGSYGEVWLARNAVGTSRAVKLVYRDRFADDRPYEREFAGIQKYEPISRTNDGLVDILQIGRNDAGGYFYYVMELADDAVGEPVQSSPQAAAAYIPKTLSRQIQSRGRLPFEECVTLGLTLNLALGHLHLHGLMHRDVKPSNIIFVNDVPKLADIGLVTGLEEGQSFVGTEGFIPPEGPNSPQADIYALGKVLYEASMGKDRHEFPDPMSGLGLNNESRRLMELNAVLLRACAHKADDRYHTAEEMNVDLALLHSGVSVKQKHALERRLKWAIRTGVALAALMLLGVAPYYLAIREAHAARLAEANANEQLWGSYLAQAQAGRFSHRQGQRFHGLDLLGRAAEMRPALELRNEAIACLALPDVRVVKEWNWPGEPANLVDFDFPRDRYARPDIGGDVSVRSLTDDREQFRLPAWRESGIVGLNLGPGGRWMITSSGTHCAVWDLEQRRLALDLTPIQCRTIALDNAGRLIAVAQGHGPILVRDVAQDREIVAIDVPNMPYSMRVDPDGRRLAVSFTGSRELKIFDLATGRLEQSCLFPGAIYHIAWRPDGKSLAAASADRHIYLWDCASKTVEATLVGHQADVVDVMFLDDGNCLGSVSWDQTFRLWNPLTQREILRAWMPDKTLRLSPDGTKIGYGNAHTRKIGILELATAHELRQIFPENSPEDAAICSAFDATGKHFATSYIDGVRVWNLATRRQLAFLPIGWTYELQFTPGGDELLTGTKAGLQAWRLKFQTETNVFVSKPQILGPPGLVTQVSASRASLVAFLQNGELRFFDLAANTEATPIKTRGPFARLSQSPDGKWLAVWGRPATEVRIWQMDTGMLVRRLAGEGGEGFARFSPDGRLLAVGGFEGYQVLETGRWTVAYSVRRQGMVVRDFAFSPDSRLLAVAHSETVVQLLDAATGQQLANLEAPEPRDINWLGFSPNGEKLAAMCSSESIQFWDIPLIRRDLASLKLDWP